MRGEPQRTEYVYVEPVAAILKTRKAAAVWIVDNWERDFKGQTVGAIQSSADGVVTEWPTSLGSQSRCIIDRPTHASLSLRASEQWVTPPSGLVGRRRGVKMVTPRTICWPRARKTGHWDHSAVFTLAEIEKISQVFLTVSPVCAHL